MKFTRRKASKTMALVSVVALIISVGWWTAAEFRSGTRVTAFFTAAVGLFPGSDVRVLGMQVGSVSDVVPQGTKVRVDMNIDNGIQIPANAKAIAVAPSLVSDRYVQFTPVYEGGPEMPDQTVLQPDRTATPMELDEINRNTDRMLTALGPDGANRNGALSDSLNVSAQNLKGNGQEFNNTIRQLGQLARTLSGTKEDMYATVDNLNNFNKTLAESDQQVGQFNTRLADTAGFLASERGELGKAMHELGPALEDVQGFIRDNRGVLKSNVEHLRAVSQVLVDQRAALAEVLDVAPLGLSNLSNSYDPATGNLGTRGNLNEMTFPPIVIVCKLLQQSAPPKPVPPILADTCKQLEPVVNGIAPLPSPADAITALRQGKAPDLPLPLVRATNGTAGAPRGGR